MTGAVYIDSFVGARDAIAAFEQVAVASPRFQESTSLASTDLPPISLPPLEIERQDPGPNEADQPVTAAENDQAPIALLTIERLGLKVPVFSGTDKISLNRGAGLVPGSALPGENGNVAVAAHRDSFFRPLKDVNVGDVMELQSASGRQHFQVSEIFITDPLDVSVLDATIDPSLTLITCYPFYYVGFAPDRYIVRGVPASSSTTTAIISKP